MTEPTPAAEPTPEAPAADQPEAPKPTETVDFWKQKAREQEKRAKDNAKAAERLAEIEEANKTEAQKLADRITAAEERASAAEQRALRFEIAAEFSLNSEQAQALQHVTSEDGMREVAKVLAAKAAQDKKSGNHVPREGASPATGVDEKREFARELFDTAG